MHLLESISASQKKPVEFQVGKHEVILGLEKAVIGMKVGQKKSIDIPPEEGFGQRRQDLVEKAKKSQFPEDLSLEVGKRLQLKFHDGSTQSVIVRSIYGDLVTLDANYPLAGRTLQFDIEVVDIS